MWEGRRGGMGLGAVYVLVILVCVGGANNEVHFGGDDYGWAPGTSEASVNDERKMCQC